MPGLKKKPSTSEALDWIRLLVADDVEPETLARERQERPAEAAWRAAEERAGCASLRTAGLHGAARDAIGRTALVALRPPNRLNFNPIENPRHPVYEKSVVICRPACSHVKQIAKWATGIADRSAIVYRAGFLYLSSDPMPIKIPDHAARLRDPHNEGVPVMTETVADPAGYPPAADRAAQPHAEQDQDRDPDGAPRRRLAAAGRTVAGPRRRPQVQEHVGRSSARPSTRPGKRSSTASSTASSSPARRSRCSTTRTSPTGTRCRQILDWTETNVHSTLNVCWGAMAAIYHFHGVPKYTLTEKAFGVYRHQQPQSVLALSATASPTISPVPVSRWTEVRRSDIEPVPGLEILMEFDRDGRLPRRTRRRATGSTCSIMWNMIRPRWPTNISATSECGHADQDAAQLFPA